MDPTNIGLPTEPSNITPFGTASAMLNIGGAESVESRVAALTLDPSPPSNTTTTTLPNMSILTTTTTPPPPQQIQPAFELSQLEQQQQQELSTTTTASGGEEGIAPFVIKTYELVNDPATQELVSWSQEHDRRAFVVYDPVEFASTVLPRYFKHSNFCSFVRQLNIYGFHKIESNEGYCFQHEYFRIDSPQLLRHIQRKKSTHRKGQSQQNQSQQHQTTTTTAAQIAAQTAVTQASIAAATNVYLQVQQQQQQQQQNQQQNQQQQPLRGMILTQPQMLSPEAIQMIQHQQQIQQQQQQQGGMGINYGPYEETTTTEQQQQQQQPRSVTPSELTEESSPEGKLIANGVVSSSSIIQQQSSSGNNNNNNGNLLPTALPPGTEPTEVYKALLGEIVKLQRQNGDTQNTIKQLKDVLMQSKSREEFLQQRIQMIADYLCTRNASGNNAGPIPANIIALARQGFAPIAPLPPALQRINSNQQQQQQQQQPIQTTTTTTTTPTPTHRQPKREHKQQRQNQQQQQQQPQAVDGGIPIQTLLSMSPRGELDMDYLAAITGNNDNLYFPPPPPILTAATNNNTNTNTNIHNNNNTAAVISTPLPPQLPHSINGGSGGGGIGLSSQSGSEQAWELSGSSDGEFWKD